MSSIDEIEKHVIEHQKKHPRGLGWDEKKYEINHDKYMEMLNKGGGRVAEYLQPKRNEHGHAHSEDPLHPKGK